MDFKCFFLMVAELPYPILGINFLNNFDLLVDVRKGRLVYKSTSLSTPDQYTIPNLQDFSANLHGCQVFLKVDLIQVYHQIPMHPNNIQKTDICTLFGSIKFLSMIFGL